EEGLERSDAQLGRFGQRVLAVPQNGGGEICLLAESFELGKGGRAAPRLEGHLVQTLIERPPFLRELHRRLRLLGPTAVEHEEESSRLEGAFGLHPPGCPRGEVRAAERNRPNPDPGGQPRKDDSGGPGPDCRGERNEARGRSCTAPAVVFPPP